MALCVRFGFSLTVSVVLFAVTSASLGFLNLEELTEMKYGIEILSEPVIKGQSKSDNIVTISSKYKQNYECKLPAIAVKFHQDKDEEQAYLGLGISDLLKPMEAAPCLIKTKDWWTYEFCYGKHIQQYHIEESELKGDILYLGYYQSEFDWNNETAKASKHHRLKRYHSQLYVNGSKCDLNGKSRETEVRFMCEEGSGDYIARVDEPQSCTYVLTVHTTRICHHPFLRMPSTGIPQSIRCHPALTPEQYVEYVKAQVSDTKRIVEELSEELKTLDLRTSSNKMSSLNQVLNRNDFEESISTEQEQQKDEIGSEASLDDITTEEDGENVVLNEEHTETDFWNKILGQPNGETETADVDKMDTFPNPNNPPEPPKDLPNSLRYKIIRNPEDLVKFITELKSSRKEKDKDKDKDKDVQSLHSEQDSTSASETQTEEVEDEQTLLQEFEKELENILLPKSDLPQIKENVKTEMEKEFENIIDEAQEEMETEGLKGEFDRKHASKSLVTTLNKLIDKLDNAVNEKDDETLESEKAMTQSDTEPSDKTPDEQADGRVKVRVTRIQRGSPEQNERKVSEVSSENSQLKHIENVIKDLLEKEGLKAEGKIEIKILTTNAFGEDGGHLLSDEDTKTLKDIVFNILVQGSEEAHKEQKRQQQLEDNYRFVWKQDQDDSKSTSAATESDDVEF
ncbi:OS-9 isoform X1 [Pelobates cultripes]|uniref:Endoplasmic reticulum lectin n=1 Tax=Pelobates cultripes TaxID=61616 RepID=A0AAD1VQR5_PELCU|nr:OS-9 isoform X1 [Pelobates cultripes]